MESLKLDAKIPNGLLPLKTALTRETEILQKK